MFDNSDEYDFTPSKNSKLASLFGLSSTSKEETSSSLIYKPPKQPISQEYKKQEGNASDESKTRISSTTVLIAKVVNLWKLENKSYELQGTFGLALIGAADLSLIEVIGYKEKNNVIFRAKVNSGFTFHNQRDNFSSFSDDKSQQWLVKFESSDQNDFSKKLEATSAKINNHIEDTDEKTLLHSEVSIPKPDISPKPLLNMETQSDSSGSQKRASILNRMAKMGQPILPALPLKNTSSELSDSEVEESGKQLPSRKYKRTIHEKAIKSEPPPSVESKQILPLQSNPLNNAFTMPTPTLYSQPFGYEGLNSFIIAQNTELKMNLTQISAKLDGVLSASDVKTNKNNNGQLTMKVKALELKSDNLQSDLQKSEKKYLNLKDKYDNLLKKIEGQSEYENIVKKVKEENLQLNISKEELEDRLEIMKSDLEKHKIQLRENEIIVENQTQKLKDLEQLCEQNKNSKELEDTIQNLNAKIENYKLKQKDFEEYLKTSNIERKEGIKKTNAKLNVYSEIVKRYMNDMYQSILDDFDDDIACTYTYNDIESIVAKQLKGTTYKLIEGCKKSFLESAELLND